MTAGVKGRLGDIVTFMLHLKKRDRLFRKARVKQLYPGAMNVLTAKLHPRRQVLRIASVTRETPSSKTFRLVPADEEGGVAFFRAGQYIAVEDEVDGTPVSRPFSICSTPAEAAGDNYYEITIKSGEGGFFAPWAVEQWEPGRILNCSEPSGTFFYEPLRDPDHLVCLAGGSGITPFRSILKDSLADTSGPRFTLFYGVTGEAEVMFRDELEALEKKHPDRFRMVVVCSGKTEHWSGETGFITAGVIRRYVSEPEQAGYFVCGPPAMYEALLEELKPFNLPPKGLRREHYGCPPLKDGGGKDYSITVFTAGNTMTVPAGADETVLVALERAGLNPPAVCRSGECGWCRSRLVEGDIFVPEVNDGRRGADRKYGWFHPCSSYPRSDLVIEVPPNPVGRRA